MRQANHREMARAGVVAPMVKGFLDPHELAMDVSIAADAMPALVTVSNGGIPAYLTNYLDPEVLRVFVTPNNAVKILDEVKKGDWTTASAQFPIVEPSGEVTSYGDFNEGGNVGANLNWPSRESYFYQTMTQWGERELEIAGEAKINYAQELNIAGARILDKFQNNTYFYGVEGIKNYGLLNDPSLPASTTASTKAAGGTTWLAGTADEIFIDITTLFTRLVSQTKGLVTREDRLVLATSPDVEANLTKTNLYNVNVYDRIKKNFPNIRIETAVQYATTAGNLVQMFAEDIEGNKTGYCAFPEKMRAHPVIVQASSYKQKKSGGTWGAIIRLPFAYASMLGV